MVSTVRKNTVSVHDLKPGMRLDEKIVALDRRLLLVEGTKLTARQIRRLQQWDSLTVAIQSHPGSADVQETMPPCLTEKYNEVVATLERAFQQVKVFNELPIVEMQELVSHSIRPLSEVSGVLGHLHLLRDSDQYSFQHSVNIGIICGVIGRWLGCQGQELLELILAGLLHDMGKALIPDEILNKPGKLTEEEFARMKNHPIDGYMLLEGADLPLRVKLGVLQHHERLDGTGYPIGLTEVAVNDYARIIAVADIFDAMTSNRVYQTAKSPFQAAEVIASQMFSQLEPSVCITFINKMRNHYIGNAVYLNDGRRAEIICFRTQTTKPIIKTEDGVILDLSQTNDIRVVKL